MEGERLAYSLHETAARLGGISVRSLQRLIASGALKAVRVGRRVLVPADALRAFLATPVPMPHNPQCAEPVAWKGDDPCYSNAQARRSGTSITGTRAATELSALVVRLTGRKRRS